MSSLADTPFAVVPIRSVERDHWTKILIYGYVFLLVLEGALRKWGVPALSQPLTLVRDPVVFLAIINHSLVGRSVLNPYTLPMIIVGVLSFCATLAFGHGNFVVGLFGLRTLLLHFFLVFIMGEILTRSDVERIGRWLLMLALPAAVLVALQFYSPQSAWVNRGVGGDLSGAGFAGAMGYMRPSGLFSFSNGNTQFFGLVATFVGYFWTQRDRCPSWLLFAATAAVIMAMPLSISRSYIIRVLLVFGFFIFVSIRSGKAGSTLILPLLTLPVVALALSQFSFMQKAIEVMTVRFETASVSEGSIGDSIAYRIFGSISSALSGGGEGDAGIPFFGLGLGFGTNLGAVLLSGSRSITISEGEWMRVVGEMGYVFGIIVMFTRVALAVHLVMIGFAALSRRNALPFMLLSASVILTLIGGWAQPTALGFCTLSAGLTLGAYNDR